MAVARRPELSTIAPVFVMRLDDGTLLIISEARSAGGGLDEVAIVRLQLYLAEEH
jgi:hypothetical protein